MKINIDGLTLRIRLQTVSRAFEELAKVYKSSAFTDLGVEYRNKGMYIAEALERRSGNE